MTASVRRVRCLTFHADYACRNTGVCCSSGWQIAVEQPVERDLRVRVQAASVRLPNGPDGFRPMAHPPEGCHSAFRLQGPACWFRDDHGRRCAIHREFGENTLPSACRQFPRVCVLEPNQVSLSLSHYCPTAAGLLFREAGPFALTDNPASFPGDWPFEGLDARGAYSPLLRPGVLLGFDGLRAFEESAVSVLGEGDVWQALARIEAAIDRLTRWTPTAGPLGAMIPNAFSAATKSATYPGSRDPRRVILAAVPAGGPGGMDLPAVLPGSRRLSAEVDRALRRYLAARLIGGWIVFQGDSLRTVARFLRLCLDTVLLFEASRAREEAEPDRWKEAIRSADLWLLHHCDPELLALNLR